LGSLTQGEEWPPFGNLDPKGFPVGPKCSLGTKKDKWFGVREKKDKAGSVRWVRVFF